MFNLLWLCKYNSHIILSRVCATFLFFFLIHCFPEIVVTSIYLPGSLCYEFSPKRSAGLHPICLALLSSLFLSALVELLSPSQVVWKTILRLPLLLSYVKALVSWSSVGFCILEQFPMKRYMEGFYLNHWMSDCLSSPQPHWVWLSTEFFQYWIL